MNKPPENPSQAPQAEQAGQKKAAAGQAGQAGQADAGQAAEQAGPNLQPQLGATAGHEKNDPLVRTLSQLLELEKAARNAVSIDSLRFTIVNRSYELLAFDRAALIEDTLRGLKVTAISNVPIVQHDAPFVQWITRMTKRLHEAGRLGSALFLNLDTAEEKFKEDWANLAPKFLLLIPLSGANASSGSWLALFRNSAWHEHEAVLFGHITEAYAQGMARFQKKSRSIFPKDKRRRAIIMYSALALVVGVMFVPVNQSVLAPAEIIAKEPFYVAAPIDGVIKEILIDPNNPISKGSPILTFEDTELRNAAAIAERSYQVVEANLRRVSQGAFDDLRNKEEVALLRAQLDKSEAERKLARERLERITIYSPASGIALFRDKNDLIGSPVKVGQRLMLVANPKLIDIQIDLPLGEAIPLESGNEVRLFLDRAPLDPLDAALTYHAYQAQISDAQIPSYRLRASLNPDAENTKRASKVARLGAKGTARIKGGSASLFFYLFRKPIAWVRQTLGI